MIDRSTAVNLAGTFIKEKKEEKNQNNFGTCKSAVIVNKYSVIFYIRIQLVSQAEFVSEKLKWKGSWPGRFPNTRESCCNTPTLSVHTFRVLFIFVLCVCVIGGLLMSSIIFAVLFLCFYFILVFVCL